MHMGWTCAKRTQLQHVTHNIELGFGKESSGRFYYPEVGGCSLVRFGQGYIKIYSNPYSPFLQVKTVDAFH